MDMKKENWMNLVLRTLSYILVAAAAAFITMVYCWKAPTKLTQLQRVIEEKFIDEVNMTQVEDEAASAMVRALGDRWSYYISAEDYSAYEERKHNSYVGIGITVQTRETKDGFNIQKVEPEGPAAKAGLQAGDVIVGVEGERMTQENLTELSDRIKGEAGTKVKVTVLRNGESLDFTVERQPIAMKVAEGQMISGNIGLVAIYNFNQNCAEETIAAAKTLLEQGAESLIFDVRNNGGGYVSEMVKILDYLLPECEVFRSIDYNGKETVENSDGEWVQVPVAVLMNGDSYSAAEFFAAALSEYDRAELVGEPTTGKGHFQYTLPLNDGSAVNLSVGRYMTPKGVDLEKTGGLEPDVLVGVDEDMAVEIYAGTLSPEEDPQVQAAVKILQADSSEKTK